MLVCSSGTMVLILVTDGLLCLHGSGSTGPGHWAEGDVLYFGQGGRCQNLNRKDPYRGPNRGPILIKTFPPPPTPLQEAIVGFENVRAHALSVAVPPGAWYPSGEVGHMTHVSY